MSERSSAVETHYIANHHLPHLSESSIDTFHVKLWINQRDLNRKSAGLMTKYIDLIVYQPPLEQVLSRVPTILNLSAKELPKDNIRGLKSALSAWRRNTEFYDSTISHIEKFIYENTAFFGCTKPELYKAACLALPKFGKKIDSAHVNLIEVIRGLYGAGFTYSSIMPFNEKNYYRKSA